MQKFKNATFNSDLMQVAYKMWVMESNYFHIGNQYKNSIIIRYCSSCVKEKNYTRMLLIALPY